MKNSLLVGKCKTGSSLRLNNVNTCSEVNHDHPDQIIGEYWFKHVHFHWLNSYCEVKAVFEAGVNHRIEK